MPSSPVVPVVAPAEIRKRAAAYVTAVPPAIQGQGGDAHTYRLAATLVVDFLLSPDEALDLLRPWNATCQPPWSESDLAKKIDNAARYGRHAHGAKLAEGKPRRTAFETADEVVNALLVELRAPLDPEATARFMADLGVVLTSPPDLADEIRGRKSALSFLLAEADLLLPWKRPVRKGRPNPGLIPRKDRGAALLAAAGAYLAAEDAPSEGAERLAWIMEEAARQHFACVPSPRAKRDEVPYANDSLDRMQNWTRTKSGVRHAPRVLPYALQRPVDPETLVARHQEVAHFRSSLSPLEREVLDGYGESDKALSQMVGSDATTAKTVKSTRGRIRAKAKAWGVAARQDEVAAMQGEA
jgi:hypothetical protein